MEDFYHTINGVSYPVHITHKRIKNIHFRFRDGAFYVSMNRLVRKSWLIKCLDDIGPRLIKRSTNISQAQGDDYMWIYGVKVHIEDHGEINFSDGSKIVYSSREDLNKKVRKHFLNLMKERTEAFANWMELPIYKVAIGDAKSRYGSNSKQTKTIRYSTMLIPFSCDIIDSVIVHENAHIKVYNHSKEFWDVVYKYCPDYDVLRKKLIKGEFV